MKVRDFVAGAVLGLLTGGALVAQAYEPNAQVVDVVRELRGIRDAIKELKR